MSTPAPAPAPAAPALKSIDDIPAKKPNQLLKWEALVLAAYMGVSESDLAGKKKDEVIKIVVAKLKEPAHSGDARLIKFVGHRVAPPPKMNSADKAAADKAANAAAAEGKDEGTPAHRKLLAAEIKTDPTGQTLRLKSSEPKFVSANTKDDKFSDLSSLSDAEDPKPAEKGQGMENKVEDHKGKTSPDEERPVQLQSKSPAVEDYLSNAAGPGAQVDLIAVFLRVKGLAPQSELLAIAPALRASVIIYRRADGTYVGSWKQIIGCGLASKSPEKGAEHIKVKIQTSTLDADFVPIGSLAAIMKGEFSDALGYAEVDVCELQKAGVGLIAEITCERKKALAEYELVPPAELMKARKAKAASSGPPGGNDPTPPSQGDQASQEEKDFREFLRVKVLERETLFGHLGSQVGPMLERYRARVDAVAICNASHKNPERNGKVYALNIVAIKAEYQDEARRFTRYEFNKDTIDAALGISSGSVVLDSALFKSTKNLRLQYDRDARDWIDGDRTLDSTFADMKKKDFVAHLERKEAAEKKREQKEKDEKKRKHRKEKQSRRDSPSSESSGSSSAERAPKKKKSRNELSDEEAGPSNKRGRRDRHRRDSITSADMDK